MTANNIADAVREKLEILCSIQFVLGEKNQAMQPYSWEGFKRENQQAFDRAAELYREILELCKTQPTPPL